jgi:hypothetical protein
MAHKTASCVELNNQAMLCASAPAEAYVELRTISGSRFNSRATSRLTSHKEGFEITYPVAVADSVGRANTESPEILAFVKGRTGPCSGVLQENLIVTQLLNNLRGALTYVTVTSQFTEVTASCFILRVVRTNSWEVRNEMEIRVYIWSHQGLFVFHDPAKILFGMLGI